GEPHPLESQPIDLKNLPPRLAAKYENQSKRPAGVLDGDGHIVPTFVGFRLGVVGFGVRGHGLVEDLVEFSTLRRVGRRHGGSRDRIKYYLSEQGASEAILPNLYAGR